MYSIFNEGCYMNVVNKEYFENKELKICSYCKKLKKYSEFSYYKNKPGSHCKKCCRIQQRERYKKQREGARKVKWHERELKKNRVCLYCNIEKHLNLFPSSNTKYCSECCDDFIKNNFFKCEECGEIKQIKEYRKESGILGFRTKCNKCENKRQRENRSKRRDDVNRVSKKCRDKNKDEYNNQKKEKLKELKKDKIAYEEYRVIRRKQSRDRWARTKGFRDNEHYRDYLKCKKKRPEHELFYIIEFKEAWKKIALPIIKENKKREDSEKLKERRKVDLNYKLKDNLRARTRKALRIQSAKKNTSMGKLLGCSGKELSEYLLSMGYNPETDHIDHIIPLSKFNLTIPEHQQIGCHYLNLQPLPAFENMSKHDNLPENWEEKIIQICEVVGIKYNSVILYIKQEIKC